MKRFLAAALVATALAVPSIAAADAAKSEGSLTVFDACTNEYVTVTGTFHYLSDARGDRSHTSASGIGLTSGDQYRYVFRFVETTNGGYFQVERLIALAPASDEYVFDDLGDGVNPTPTCR